MNSSVYGKRSLVLGGSGGIGRELSLLLAQAGSRVLVHGGHSAEALDSCLKEIEAAGGEAEAVLLPLARPCDVDPLFTGRPPFDIVVSAFGPFVRGGLSDLSAEDWERATLLNLSLPGYLVSRSLEAMEKQGYGVFLFFGGTNTDMLRGYQTSAAYSAAKAGLGTVAKSVALRSAARGVRANVLCPGLVETEYCDADELLYMKGLSGALPLLKPSEVGSFALAVIENSLLNGSIIAVDAGLFVGTRPSV